MNHANFHKTEQQTKPNNILTTALIIKPSQFENQTAIVLHILQKILIKWTHFIK